ncbi:MAG TPA: hypothetical protein VKB59_23420 [Micromonosporaceae bacterium]|nr:hypothetical protein [Micromonosporaceae bacterium]
MIARWNADELVSAIAADAPRVVAQILRDEARPMNASAIRARLGVLGVDSADAERAWKRAQPRLKDRSDIADAGSRSYKWIGDDRVDGVVDETPGGAPRASTRKPATGGGTTPRSVATLLNKIAGHPRATVADLAERPLQSGVRLSQQPDAALTRLLTSVSETDQSLMCALMLATPRDVPELDLSAPDQAGLEALAVVASNAAREIAEVDQDDVASHEAAAALVWRLAGIQSLPAAFTGPIVELAHSRSARDSAGATVTLESAGRAVAGLLPRLSADERAALDPNKVAATFAGLRLRRDGSRALVLAAAGRTWPEQIASAPWWHNVTLAEIARSADDVLADVLSVPAVAETVVRPMIATLIAEANDRTDLAFLIGLPAGIAANVSDDAFAQVFERIAAADRTAAAWLQRLPRGEPTIDRIDGGVTDRAALDRAMAAEERVRELTDRCERLEAQLTTDYRRSVELRAAQNRQLQVDIVRALAELAAEVEELCASGVEPRVLVDRVRGLVAGEGLEPIGSAGAGVPFDPTLHIAAFGRPEVGAVVAVIRPGYRWLAYGRNDAINKALVAT